MSLANLTPKNVDWNDYFIYHFEGKLVWKERPETHFKDKRAWKIWNSRFSGTVAGRKDQMNRVAVKNPTSTKDSKIFVHRVIWEMFNQRIENPSLTIDHIDGNPSNNKIENLRLCRQQENQFNRKDAKGYYWCKKQRMWCAMIKLNSKKIHLGYFQEEIDARKAYLSAKLRLHGLDYMPEELKRELSEADLLREALTP